MTRIITTCLDVLAILLLAAGAAGATYQYMGWACLIVSGVVVALGSQLAAWLNEPKRKKT